MLRRTASNSFVLLFLCQAGVLRADDWPSFRGGSKAGVAEAKTLPDAWDNSKNVVWKVGVAGRGWSSPIVSGGRVFVTAVVSDAEMKSPQKGLYINDLNGKVPPGEHRWLVFCLDFKSGKILWQREVYKGKPTSAIHIKNSYASGTPVADGERVYAAFGNVGVFCFDREGKELWKYLTTARSTQMNWGPASSLALHKERIFILDDNEEASTLTAVEAKSGKPLWKIERAEKSNWTTPFIWENDKRTEIVTAGKSKVRSYDLDGKLLWELEGMSMIAIPTPFAAHGLLYVTSGYVLDGKRPLYAIKPGASGDITLPRGQTSSKDIAWSQPQAGPYHPTPVVYGDYIYVLYDRGFLSCYEAKTGKPVYEKQRLPGATAFTASPWAYDGKIFCLSEDGETYVIEAGKEFKVVSQNKLEAMTLASPALAGGSLLIRTIDHLYRLEKK